MLSSDFLSGLFEREIRLPGINRTVKIDPSLLRPPTDSEISEFVKDRETKIGAHVGPRRFQYRQVIELSVPLSGLETLVKKYGLQHDQKELKSAYNQLQRNRARIPTWIKAMKQEYDSIFTATNNFVKDKAMITARGILDSTNVYITHTPVSEENMLGITLHTEFMNATRADLFLFNTWYFGNAIRAQEIKTGDNYHVVATIQGYTPDDVDWLKFLVVNRNPELTSRFLQTQKMAILSQIREIIDLLKQGTDHKNTHRALARFFSNFREACRNIVREPFYDKRMNYTVKINQSSPEIDFQGPTRLHLDSYDGLIDTVTLDGYRINSLLINLYQCQFVDSNWQEYASKLSALINSLEKSADVNRFTEIMTAYLASLNNSPENFHKIVNSMSEKHHDKKEKHKEKTPASAPAKPTKPHTP